MDRELLAERLKAARYQAGWSQRQLAEKCHMVQQTVAGYERAKVKLPTTRALKRFAEVLKVDLNWLTGNALKRREIFAERLRLARNALGISLEELAFRVHMSPTGIGSYERRTCCPPPETLRRLAETLNVSEAWLSGNDWLLEAANFDETRIVHGSRAAKENP